MIAFALSLISLLTFTTLAVSSHIVPPNQLIAFASNQNGNWDIYLLDIPRGMPFNLTRHPADDLSPSWLPQTGQIVFYSTRSGTSTPETYLMRADGSDLHPVQLSRRDYWRVRWAPDGDQILFVGNYGSISVMNADGSNEHHLARGFGPVWSPTEAKIAYYADEPTGMNGDIYLVDADGRNALNVTRHQAHDWDPAWSPDARQLAFVSSRDGNAEIYITDARCEPSCSQEARRLTYTLSTERAPAWSLDGERIAFESEVNGASFVYIVNADGTGLHPLIAGRSPVWLSLRGS